MKYLRKKRKEKYLENFNPKVEINRLLNKKISDVEALFKSLRKYYYLYYIPRVKMFENIDILLVKK